MKKNSKIYEMSYFGVLFEQMQPNMKFLQNLDFQFLDVKIMCLCEKNSEKTNQSLLRKLLNSSNKAEKDK